MYMYVCVYCLFVCYVLLILSVCVLTVMLTDCVCCLPVC